MSQANDPIRRDGDATGESCAATPEVSAHVIDMTELTPRPPSGSGAPVPLSSLGDSPLRHVKARLTVCVGSAEVTVGELLDATEQQVLRLDRTVEQPVDVLLDGHVVARGLLVAVDEHFGVRITEVPLRADPAHQARR